MSYHCAATTLHSRLGWSGPGLAAGIIISSTMWKTGLFWLSRKLQYWIYFPRVPTIQLLADQERQVRQWWQGEVRAGDHKMPPCPWHPHPAWSYWSSCRWGKMHNTGNLTVGLWQSPGYCDPQPGVIMSSCAPDSWYWGTAPHQLELTGVGSRSSSSCPYTLHHHIFTPPQSSHSLHSFMHCVQHQNKGIFVETQPTQHSTKCCNQLTLLPWNLHCIMSSSD